MQKVILIFLIGCLIFSCQKGKTPTKNETSNIFTSVPMEDINQNTRGSVLQILKINNYKIEAQVYTHINEGNYPTVTNKITLDGITYSSTSTPGVNHAELYFYSDERSKFKAYYDSTKKTIYAFYPISNFDRIYDLIKNSNSEILLQYYDCALFESIEVTFQVHGSVGIHP
jgi:hypothetical protein